eukprot:1116466-Pleurochrysis_carterae.AAC.1
MRSHHGGTGQAEHFTPAPCCSSDWGASTWRLSKWRAYNSDPLRGACRSIDFGYSSMPGGSKLQALAREVHAAYQLRSLRDPKGKHFFYSLVVPWLHEAWRRVQMADAQVAQ